MPVGAAPEIMLVLHIAWRCFEGAQELFDPFDVGLCAAWFRFGLFVFPDVQLVHLAHEAIKIYAL